MPVWAAQAHQRDKLERLCRNIARSAVSEKRLSLTAQGKMYYEQKTPYSRSNGVAVFALLKLLSFQDLRVTSLS